MQFLSHKWDASPSLHGYLLLARLLQQPVHQYPLVQNPTAEEPLPPSSHQFVSGSHSWCSSIFGKILVHFYSFFSWSLPPLEYLACVATFLYERKPGRTRATPLSVGFLLSPQFSGENAEERLLRRLRHTRHFLKNLASFSRLSVVPNHLRVWNTGQNTLLHFLFIFLFLVDLLQNLHRGRPGLSVGCRGSIDSRLLFEQQMK